MSDLETIELKFELLRPAMDERMCHLWAACEAKALGPHGETIVATATGLSTTVILEGLKELEQLKISPPLKVSSPRLPRGHRRVRRPGGGRKLVEVKDPAIITTLEELIENETAGDPTSEQKWVRSSLSNLSEKPLCANTSAGYFPVQSGYDYCTKWAFDLR